IGRPVGRETEALRHRRENVEVAVELEEAAEHVGKEVPGCLPVRIAGRECIELEPARLETLCRLDSLRLGNLPGERLAVGPVRLLEIEREVVRQRDLEQRVARPPSITEPVEEVERAPVVSERLLLGVEPASRVAGLEQ